MPLVKINFSNFLRFYAISGTENRLKTAKNAIFDKKQLQSRRLLCILRFGSKWKLDVENLFLNKVLRYPATSWYPEKQHVLLVKHCWPILDASVKKRDFHKF